MPNRMKPKSHFCVCICGAHPCEWYRSSHFTYSSRGTRKVAPRRLVFFLQIDLSISTRKNLRCAISELRALRKQTFWLKCFKFIGIKKKMEQVMTRSGFLDPQIKNNPSRAENSPLYFLGNHVPTVQKNTGRSKEIYVEMQKTKASGLKIEGWSIYFLYIQGLILVFGWILKSQGPYAFAILCRAQRKTGLFVLEWL